MSMAVSIFLVTTVSIIVIMFLSTINLMIKVMGIIL